MKRATRVVLTDHFLERYHERVGSAPPHNQKKWLENSIRKKKPRRQGDGKYRVKLTGSKHVAILARDASTWVAVTIR